MSLACLSASVFQSPCGDLLIGNLEEASTPDAVEMFQSPCGDLLIGNINVFLRFLWLRRVSVPLRGFINRKLVDCHNFLLTIYEFQSPCGDLLIGNSKAVILQCGKRLFQSPCGDLLIGNLTPDTRYLRVGLVSVPLRGFINRKPRNAR